jgi:hypothetical protein
MAYLGRVPANVPVTASDIPDNSITAAKILDGVITPGDLSANAVTTAKIAGDAVDGTKIADDAINSEHITAGGVDDAHLATGITASKLTGNLPAISAALLTNIPAANITGALPAISGANLTGITGTTTRIHAFSTNAAGKLIWTHTEGTLSLTNSSGVDNYLDWHIGSSDQVYTVNSDGKLICTYT